MDILAAIKVMRALADALDPETGMSLPPHSVCRKNISRMALNRSIGALVAQQERDQNRPASSGKYWSSAEDARICEEIRKGLDLREVAKLHNRTLGSVVVRLVRLGKIAPPKSAEKSHPRKVA